MSGNIELKWRLYYCSHGFFTVKKLQRFSKESWNIICQYLLCWTNRPVKWQWHFHTDCIPANLLVFVRREWWHLYTVKFFQYNKQLEIESKFLHFSWYLRKLMAILQRCIKKKEVQFNFNSPRLTGRATKVQFIGQRLKFNFSLTYGWAFLSCN